MPDSWPEAVTLAQAVALSGLSERTIRRHVRAGRLPSRKTGRSLLLPRAAVLDLAGRPATTDRIPAMADTMADSTGQPAALAPLLDGMVAELAALRRQNEGLHGLVVALNGQLDEGRRLLTCGDVARLEAARVEGELRVDLARAVTGRRWAVALAALVGALALVLAVALVRRG